MRSKSMMTRLLRSHALRTSVRRSASVLLALTVSDLRARYGRGAARLVKWLLDPFAVIGVYLLLVTFMLDREGPAPGLSLACAVVPFQLLMLGILNGIGAVGRRRAILLNMKFQRELLPLASVATESVAFGANLFVLALMMAIYGVAPTFALLWFPLAVATTVVLAIACAYPASLFGVWFPDLRNFAVSFVRTMFFVAPGLVALNEIRGRTQDIVRLNPLTGIFESYRDTLLYGNRPAAWQILYPLAFSVVLLLAFLPLYRREQRQFAKVIE
jgi:ABC-type polysaccharide/polyol phosphate export permease